MAPKFEILRMPPENTNSVLVSSGADAIIFDPWGRADDWARTLDARHLTPRALFATHAHPDHISAAPDLCVRYNIPLYVAQADAPLIGWGNEILDMFDLPRIVGNVPTHDITPGRHQPLAGLDMDVWGAPGHTPGGRMFYFPAHHILLAGDTLFRDGFGRYDFPGGDRDALFESISTLYNKNLPTDTYVVHGHGPDSTIESLLRTNPYFKAY